MYARLVRARFRPERGEEVIRIARESLAVYRRARGCRGVTYLYERASGWGFVLSQWDTAADAAAVAAALGPTMAALAPHYDRASRGGFAISQWATTADAAAVVAALRPTLAALAPDAADAPPIFEVVAQA